MRVFFSKETCNEYGLEMDEDDEDDYYDKLYDDVDFAPPDDAVMPTTSKEIKENGIHERNGHTEKITCQDAVRGMMFTDLPVKPFPDELVFNIYTTEVVSPKSFYGQLVTANTVACLQELSDQLGLYKSYEAIMPPFAPKINELCVAKFKEDQEWYRAFVLRYIDNDDAEVFFVDYGNKCDVHYENIRCINERLLNFPRYAMNFAIDDIRDETPKMKEIMVSLLLNKPACVTCLSIEGNTMICDVDSDSGVRLINALKGISDEPEPKTMFVDLPAQVIHSSTEFEVFVVCVNSLSDISVWIGDYMNIQTKVEEFTTLLFEKITSTSGNFTPVVGEVCAGFNEEYQEWYRIHILEILADGNVNAKLIDYGYDNAFKARHLASFPDESFCVAPQVSTISLSDVLTDCTDDAFNLLKKRIAEKQVVVNVDKYTDRYIATKISTNDGVDVLTKICQKQPASEEVQYKRYKKEDLPKCHIASDSFHIVVTSVGGPRLFYGQIDKSSMNDSFKRISKDLAKSVVKSSVVPTGFKPTVGEMYACSLTENDDWYRIHVEEICEEVASVTLIDIGKKATVSFSNIYPLSSELALFPIYGVAFSLHDHDKLPEDQVKKFVEDLRLKKVRVEKVFEADGIYHVRVFTSNADVDYVTASLRESSKKEKDSLDIVPYETDPYTKLPAIAVPEQCAVMVTHVSSLSLVYGQVYDENTAEKHFELKVDMNDHCSKNQHVHVPTLNEVCCALYEEEWCRVYVTELKQKVAKVFFIDFGNYEDIAFNKLRRCPSSFLLIPSLAVPFQLVGADLVSESDQNTYQLKEKLENEISMVTVTDRSNKLVIVSVDGLDINEFFERLDCDEKEPTEKEKLELSIRSLEEDIGFLCSDSSEIEPTRKSDIDTDSLNDSFEGPLNYSQGSGTNDRYVLSSLPAEIHPLEAVEMKMDISTLSTNVTNLLVTHVETPWLIYGVPTDETVCSKVEKMVLELKDTCSADSSLDENFRLKAGVLCAAKDSSSNWSRAVICDVKVSNCSLFFVDSGKLSIVPHESIRLLDKQFKIPPAQAIAMKLMTVRPLNGAKTWSDEANDFFRGMVNGEVVRTLSKYRYGVVNNVKLKIDKNSVVLDKLFEAEGYAERFIPVIYQDIGVHKTSKDRELVKKSVPFEQVTKVIEMEKAPDSSFLGIITCVVSPRLFYARIYDDVKLSRVDNISEELKNLYGDAPYNDFPLKKGELCAVLCEDNRFYRGYVIEDDNDNSSMMSLVWLVDYGLRSLFTGKQLWPLPEDMKSFPAQAFTMQLTHVLPKNEKTLYSPKALNKFQSMIIDKVMQIEIDSFTEHMNRVLIYDPKSGVDIGDILVRNGFAKYYYGKGPSLPPKSANRPNYRSPSKLMDSYVPPPANTLTLENTLNASANSTDETLKKKKKKKKKKKGGATNQIEECEEDVKEEFVSFNNAVGQCEKCSTCDCNSRVNNENSYPVERRPMRGYRREPCYSERGPCHPPPRHFYEDDEVYAVYQGGYNPNYESNSYAAPYSSSRYRFFENGYPDPRFYPSDDTYCFKQDKYSNYRKTCSNAPRNGAAGSPNADRFIQNRVDLLKKKSPPKPSYPSGFDKHVSLGDVHNDGNSKPAAGRGTGSGRGRGRGQGY